MFQLTNVSQAATIMYLVERKVGAFAGWLYQANVILCTTLPTFDPAGLVSSLVQPTYPGYTSPVLTWPVNYFHDQDGDYASASVPLLFQMADSSTPTVIRGIAIASAPSGNVLYNALEILDTPISLQTADDALALAIRVSLGNDGLKLASLLL